MKLIKQSWSWEFKPQLEDLWRLEDAARTCYQSEPKGDAPDFIRRLISIGHHTIIEHGFASVRIITDRGVTHEMVRHRIASFSQESTRYVKYEKGDMEFILPVWLEEPTDDETEIAARNYFVLSCEQCEKDYKKLREMGWSAQKARDVLNNSVKTEIVMTANFREWRHFFSLRAQKPAHPQMRALATDMLIGFQMAIPVIFDDIEAT